VERKWRSDNVEKWMSDAIGEVKNRIIFYNNEEWGDKNMMKSGGDKEGKNKVLGFQVWVCPTLSRNMHEEQYIKKEDPHTQWLKVSGWKLCLDVLIWNVHGSLVSNHPHIFQ